MVQITRQEYSGFQTAFNHFNKVLFANALPQVLVSLQRHPKMRGYFWASQFLQRGGNGKVDEIALNPEYFTGRSDEEILSTLVHEMCHLWQSRFGNPGRRAYHNQEWATCMKGVGLYPSNTGQPGGKETGEQMTHYVVQDGPYQRAYRALAVRGIRLNWQAVGDGSTSNGGGSGTERRKTPTRAKYTCSTCGLNAWAKFGANLTCGDCETVMEIQG